MKMSKSNFIHTIKTQRNMRRIPYIHMIQNFSWHTMSSKLLIGLGVLCMTTWSMQAQEEEQKKEKENLGTEVVNIVQSYKPSISKSSKQSLRDRKSTRLNSSHVAISYAVYC